jgi:glycosyltransferase involved in cell wall biosynthesis
MVRHGDNGLLVAYDDGEAFRAAAERLAGQLGWVRAMGAQARVTASGLEWGRIIQQVEQVYTTAISQPLAAPRAAWRPVLP